MKKFVLIFMVLISSIFSFIGCDIKNNSQNVIRIHIRANSNNENDQNVKLKVRDEVINYITPLIADCENSNDVKNVLLCNLENIESIADSVLKNNGFIYTSSANINNEYFPSREYNGVVFSSDYYDALILNLGTGTGDNWWCVAYPPLCFVGNESEGAKVKYKSKILELINKCLEG